MQVQEMNSSSTSIRETKAQKTSTYPRIRHCSFLDHGIYDSAVMLVGHRYFEITGKELTREQFMIITRYLDGWHSLEEISSVTGLAIEQVTGVVRLLQRIGGMEAEEGGYGESIPVSEFLRLIDRSCNIWSRELRAHPLFVGLDELSLPREVFVGLIIETYHYVNSAPRHIATAIAHNQNPRYDNRYLVDYFMEESDHSALILQAIERLGIGRQQVEASYPGPGTIALTQMLCEAGRTGALAYLTCMNFFEMQSRDFEESSVACRKICVGYGWPADAMDPVISHAREDVEAAHSSLLSKVLEGAATIDRCEADTAVQYAHDLKHCFDQHFDQIVKYYSNISNHIPRRPVRSSSL
jgi:pyrroloquinoline quinone (PQQ) biosynthesis protein C